MPHNIRNKEASSADVSLSPSRPEFAINIEQQLAEARRLFSLHEFMRCEELVLQVLQRDPNNSKAKALLDLTAIKLFRRKLYQKIVNPMQANEGPRAVETSEAVKTGSTPESNRERTIAALCELFPKKDNSPRHWKDPQLSRGTQHNENETESSHAPSNSSEQVKARELMLSAISFYEGGKILEALSLAREVLSMMPHYQQAREIVDLLQKRLDEEKRKELCANEGEAAAPIISDSIATPSSNGQVNSVLERELHQVPVSTPAPFLGRETEQAQKRRPAVKAKRMGWVLAIFACLVGSSIGGFLAFREYLNTSSLPTEKAKPADFATAVPSSAEESKIAELPATNLTTIDKAQIEIPPPLSLSSPPVSPSISSAQSSTKTLAERSKAPKAPRLTKLPTPSRSSTSQELRAPAKSWQLPTVNLPEPPTTAVADPQSQQSARLTTATSPLLKARDGLLMAPAPVLKTPASEVSNTKAAYNGPVSGRILWSGQLEKNDVVLISGKVTSMGSTQGELPGVPVKIHITTKGIGVVTAPGLQNGWKHLVIRNEGRKQSVVEIKWTVIQ